jgi:predicted nuclease with RNAse H fold
MAIVECDMKDAVEGGISADWRFGIAYNAALKLCTILLYAEGYKAERTLQRYRTIYVTSQKVRVKMKKK